MAFLGKEVLGKGVLKRREVAIPEWGGTALCRELTIEEVEEVRRQATESISISRATATVKNNRALTTMGLLTAARGWIHQDGTRVLTDEEAMALRRESNRAIQRIIVAVSELSGIVEGDEEDSGSVEEAEKNSEPSLNGASPTS